MNSLAPIDKEFKSILEKRGMLSNEMGSEISDSWGRCILNGLDPFKGPKKSVISSQELDQIREEKEDLRKIVIPELELLYSQVAGTNFMVAFSDNEGLVLDTIYDKTCLQTDVGKSVIPGSIWAEKICGTNGLGLAVEIKKPTKAGLVDLEIGDIKAGVIYSLNYDGTYFQITSPYGEDSLNIKYYILLYSHIIEIKSTANLNYFLLWTSYNAFVRICHILVTESVIAC